MRSIPFTLIILSLFISFAASAQSRDRDSVEYYQHRIGRIYRAALESLSKSDSVDYYRKHLQRALRRSRGYSAFSVSTAIGDADFRTLNKAIAKDGFGPVSGPVWGIGIGFSVKADNGGRFEFNFFTLGIDRKSTKGDEKIKANYGSFFQAQLGCDIVNTRVFSLYPYVGLSARLSSLEYSKPQVVNPNWNSIASIVQNNQSVLTSGTHLSYQAGLGMDLLLTKSDRLGGIIFFGKFGTDGIFGHENYTIDDVKYSSGIRYGAWETSFGFKFFGRR